MRTGRPPSPVKLLPVTIRLSADTVATLDLLCLDPFTGALIYGQRNELIEQALREHFALHYPTRKELS